MARYGGEEILVILPHTPGAAALKLGEKLRRTIAESVMVPASSSEEGEWPEIKITVSIGIGELSPEVKSANELFALADQALYRAKNRGRNCCVVARSRDLG